MSVSRRDFLKVGAASLGGCALPLKVFAQVASGSDLMPLPADLQPNITHPVNVGLGLLMDSSGSVDDSYEFVLQRGGTAAALRSDRVKSAIEAVGSVAICCGQFNTSARQTVAHALLRSGHDAEVYADVVAAQQRIGATYTGIANGLEIQAGIVAASPYNAIRQVIDISGDGIESRVGDGGPQGSSAMSMGERRTILRSKYDHLVRQVSDNVGLRHGITINGLAICRDVSDLDAYYRDVVVTSQAVWEGTGGLVAKGQVWAIDRFEDVQRAMEEKLVSEILFARNDHSTAGIPIHRIG